MSIIAEARPVTIEALQSAGDGGFATAAAVEIRSPRTLLLVDLFSSGLTGIKLLNGRPGDCVDVFVISQSSTLQSGLAIYDDDGYGLISSNINDVQVQVGSYIKLSKILVDPYISSGIHIEFGGTWIGEVNGFGFGSFRQNTMPST